MIKEIFLNIDDIFLNIAHEKGTIYLKSESKYSILGFYPKEIFTCKKDKIDFLIENKSFMGDPIKELDKFFKRRKSNNQNCQEILKKFSSCFLGYFAYEFAKNLEKLSSIAQDKQNIPDVFLGFYENLIIHNHSSNKTYILYKEQKIYTEIIALSKLKYKNNFKKFKPEIRTNISKNEYLSNLEKIKEYLRAGEVYQVCLTQKISFEYKGKGSELFLRWYKSNPVPFGAYLNCGDFEVLSVSPERFIKVQDGVIETCPIKGTIKRDIDPIKDKLLTEKLINSVKENAELTMIVDLERNDLGKICEFGSVKVIKHRALKPYKFLWHTYSLIRGKLKKNLSLMDIIKAVFPGGSITGTPKIRAMDIIFFGLNQGNYIQQKRVFLKVLPEKLLLKYLPKFFLYANKMFC